MQRALSPVLIGRERELGILEDTLLTASRGDARVALIAGEAGMGKTRLADELISRAHKIGFEVLTGGCSEADLSLPYLPFVEAIGNFLARSDLQQLRERLGPSARELGRLFPRLAGTEAIADAGDPAHARLRICEALTDLLQVPAELRGLLLVLEDLHWADASTREVLDFLVRRLRTGRVMILGTYRSDEMHRKHPLLPTVQGWMRAGLVDLVELGPLSPDGVAGMVRAIFDQERVTDEFRDFLHSRCEGNPFVLEEMLKLAMDRGDIYRGANGWERKELRELRLPRTVKDTILMRVERLDEEKIQLLGTAAVLGQSFETLLLTAASGQTQKVVEDTLQAAEQQQILEEENQAGRYRFRHALTREVIYEDLPAPKRERLHLKAAEALRARTEVPTVDVVYHLMAANAFAEAVPLCLQAAREASRASAYEEAADLFRLALPHVREARSRAEILVDLGDACTRSGEVGSAREYLSEGIAELERLADPIAAAGARIHLSRVWGFQSHTGEERAELERAVAVLEPAGPSEALAQAYMRLAAIHSFNYEYTPGLVLANKALDVAAAVGAEAVRIYTYNYLGLALNGSGRVEEGYESLWRSYHEAVDRGLRWIAGNALHNMMALLAFGGELRARETLPILNLIRELRVGPWSTVNALLDEATTRYFLSDFDVAVSLALKAIESSAAGGNLWVVRFGEINLGLVRTELGDFDIALPLLGITHEERQRDSQEAVALIRFALATGDIEPALEAGRFLLSADEGGVGTPFSAEVAVEALVAGGAVNEAIELLKGFERRPWLRASPYVVRAWARVELAEGKLEAAATHGASVLEAFRAAGYPADEARSELLLARAISGSDPRGAELHIRSAAAIADQIKSAAIRYEAESAIRELGGELDRAPLPPVEAEVADSAPGERLVTVLFADVRGYTAMAGALAPAELADKVAALQRWALVEVERHHGVLDKFAGDALMATFNVSGASIDHCLHALQTAFAIRDKAAMLGLPVGVGIATGPAVVGRMAKGANLSVLGEATNLASRLQGQATAGEILLSEESNRRVVSWLTERGMAPQQISLSLKGIRGETLAYRLRALAEAVSA
jgi:class 3 adenylate cyclase